MEFSEHLSKLDDALIGAYRATRYRVLAPIPFDLTVDVHSPALEALMQSANVRAAAFVTAWNPRGETWTLPMNRARQEALRAELRALGLPFVEGFGAYAGDVTQGEESLLVLGVERRAACSLGTRHEQNAIVWSGSDAVPRLLLLR